MAINLETPSFCTNKFINYYDTPRQKTIGLLEEKKIKSVFTNEHDEGSTLYDMSDGYYHSLKKPKKPKKKKTTHLHRSSN